MVLEGILGISCGLVNYSERGDALFSSLVDSYSPVTKSINFLPAGLYIIFQSCKIVIAVRRFNHTYILSGKITCV